MILYVVFHTGVMMCTTVVPVAVSLGFKFQFLTDVSGYPCCGTYVTFDTCRDVYLIVHYIPK